MQLTVLILNYNARFFLELCLLSVQRAVKNIDTQIIVVDNNSSDASVTMVGESFPDVELIVNPENSGFAAGNNLGFKSARGEYLCILNPDTIVGEQVFEKCLAFAKAESQIGFIGTQLIDGTGSYLPESKRNVPTPKVALSKLLGKSNSYYANEVATDENAEVDVLVGAFMLCKTAVYKKLGMLDERYFMYGEDIDLSYTAIKAGLKNYYLGQERIIHFKGESTVKNREYSKRFYGAMQLFYKKHFKSTILLNMLVALGTFTLRFKTYRNDNINLNKSINRTILVSNTTFNVPFNYDLKSTMDLLGSQINRNDLIIWDIENLSINEVITFMKNNTDSNLTYRFLNAQRTFYAGSDTATARGAVAEF